ncbi:MAG: PLP-dependent transferase [Nitrospirae bacterium]|nr:PLP-dependent transferase [Nitrospirota bacterium]
MEKREKGFGTVAVHAGEDGFPYRPSSTPIYQTSTYTFDTVGDAAAVMHGARSGFVYTRIGNPTVQAFEKKLAALEGADDAVAFASGMAAISAVFLELLRPGDEAISCSQIYSGTRGFYDQILSRTGCVIRHFSPHEDIRKKIPLLVNRKTRLIFFETPSNPELSIVDMGIIASIARDHNIFSVIDNTFATPYLQRPFDHGVDCVVHSATKYIGGHGDAIGGIVAGKSDFISRLRKNMLLNIGGCLSPFNAWLYLRGLKTLHVRMDHHCRAAATIADFLVRHRQVRAVLYPGLSTHPGHDVARRQMRGFGGMVSFRLTGRAACRKVLDRLRLCKIGVSLGDAETLAMNSALMFYPGLTDAACRKIGIDPGLIRLSTGLEDAQDIIDDLGSALKKL